MRLEGKSTIVTGGASGFGAGIATRFVAEGARVAILDLNAGAAQALAEQLGPSAMALACDVSVASDVFEAVEEVASSFGGLDIIVNNAGFSHLNRPMLEVDEPTFDRVFDVNVKSIFHMAHAALPVLRRQDRGGAIVNVSSTAGLRPRPGLSWYNASKGAVNILTKSMAVELAPERIRVNAVAPVAGNTPMLPTFLGGNDTPERRQRFIDTIPLGRLSEPTDIAAAVLYLASDDAAFITGAVLEVDGGRCV